MRQVNINKLAALSKFKPILSSCHQGQRRPGVEDGALYIYKNCFQEIFESKPFIIQNVQFNSQYGY